MSIPGSLIPLFNSGGGGYQITRSLRFNSADSAYASRVAGTPTASGTWTLSVWVKRAALGGDYALFGANASSTYTQIYFKSDNTIRWYENVGDINGTAAVFRDVSAWSHLVFRRDGTSSMKIYHNGVEISQTTSSIPSSSPFNSSGATIYIGRAVGSGFDSYANSYLSDIHFIDGQALTPSDFGETDTNGVWQPKAYTGSYGTNGFRLDFVDNSSTTALGYDAAGSNDWTPNNLSVTAGVGNDSLVDSPTNYGTDTGVGGEVRGNYCTLNPLPFSLPVISNGNLETTGNSSWQSAFGTIKMPSTGKWYWEATIGNAVSIIGIAKTIPNTNTYLSNWADTYGWYGSEGKKSDGPVYNPVAYAFYAASDVVGVAYDAGAGSLTYYKNGVSQGVAFSGLSGEFFPVFSTYGGGVTSLNFGQRPFAYTAPSGFKALCTQNLPAPTIAKPSTVMDTVLYTGTGATLTPTSTLGFSPDLVWIKSRSAATDNTLYDVVRGAQARLESNTTDAEVTSDNGLTAFNSNGFTLGTLAQVNTNTATYAGWCWDGGSLTVTNTSGSISSQVRANASAGFSVVTYNSGGTGSTLDTVGHGLGVSPSMVIAKNRDIADSFYVLRSDFSNPVRDYLRLNSTAAKATVVEDAWSFSSTTVGIRQASLSTASGQKILLYCFAPVAGYSAFGTYTGTATTDGPFVYTGFRPSWIMIKSTQIDEWLIIDTKRDTSNVAKLYSSPTFDLAEVSTIGLADVLSNGFKIRSTDSQVGTTGRAYIYAAFAEHPFQYSRAR